MGIEYEVNSDDELLDLLESSDKSKHHLSSFDTKNLVNEYTKYGVFKAKDLPDSEPDVYKSKLFLEMVSTLKHLSDSYTSHEYVRYVFVKDLSYLEKNVNFSRSGYYEDGLKHYEVLVHKKPYHLIGKCTLRDIDGPVGTLNNDNLSVKVVNTVMVSSDIVNVIPSLGFKLYKKHNVDSLTFHLNYGTTSYSQISLFRYFEDDRDIMPSSLFAEIKCFGTADLEFYKNRINTLSKLLYKFLKF